MSRLIKLDIDGNYWTVPDQTPTAPQTGDAIYISDWFRSECVQQLIDNQITPSAIVTDVEGTVLPLPVPFYFIPALDDGLLTRVNELRQATMPDHVHTQYCFNFSINKKQPERYMLLKLIEWFKFQNYNYTWSGVGKEIDGFDLVNSVDINSSPWLTSEFKTHILSPVSQLAEKWVCLAQETLDPNISGRPYGSFRWVWDHVQSHLTPSTAITLITESSSDCEKNYVFTEKTLWSIMGLTFPIWVGNYGQAQQAQDIGLDVFGDIVDHSYQYKPTVLERCYHAVNDNIHLLTDLNLVSQLRDQHIKRLLNNRDYMFQGKINNWVDAEIKKMPENIQAFLFNRRLILKKPTL